MNKVITINLGGTAYQLEEPGFDALRGYLETASARLKANPDREEIISDIERAIGEKFRALSKGYKTVVDRAEVAAVLLEMGPIEDPATDGETRAAATSAATPTSGAKSATESGEAFSSGEMPRRAKRLFKIEEGAMLAGVCNGLGAYFNLDPTFIRLGFVFLLLFWGTGLLVYCVLAFVLPTAETPAEKAAAQGEPFTTQEFIRRAKAGYYEATKAFPDRESRRQWKRRMKQEMRGWGRSFRGHVQAGAGGWGGGGGAFPLAAGFMLPLFSVLHSALMIAGLSTLVSLLATGGLFGVALPTGMPVWVAVLVVLVGYGFLAWPLKAARWAVHHGNFDRSLASWPFVCFLDGLIRVATIAVALWLVFRYLPEAREALHNIPGLVREAVSTIKEWWGPK